MFLHFGLYAVPGGVWKGKNYYGCSEWLQRRGKIPIAEYETIAKEFNPVSFNAEEWVRFAKDQGFRYIIITTKHHDGFAMFGSKVSKYNIVEATPFKRDLIKELADACKKLDMKLGFYYSQSQDWYEADAIGNDWDFKDHKKNFQKYLDEKCKPQLEELLTNYGEVAILWFDTPQEITKEESQQLVDWVHKFQPNCLTSSRVGNNLGEYQALQDHNLPRNPINRPFEALFTHNESWGYSKLDKNFRSPKEILHILLASNSKGGNLILNIGPKPDGVFQEESIRDFRVIGDWLKKNAEAVYSTKASPYKDMPWGHITTKPGTLYLHVMNWPGNGQLRLPFTGASVTHAGFLASGKKITVTKKGDDILLQLPVTAPDKLCTVIKIAYSGTLQPDKVLPVEAGYTTVLYPEWAIVSGTAKAARERWMEEFGDWHYASIVTGWKTPADKAEWEMSFAQPGKYKVVLNYHFASKNKTAEGVLRINGKDAVYFQSTPTGDQIRNFYEHSVGIIDIRQAGKVKLSIAPANAPDAFIDLQEVKLIPYE